MVATQSFRLVGTTQTVDIHCDTVDGENIIFWDEIEYVFPGARLVIKNDNVAVKMMRDSNHNSNHVESSALSGPFQADAACYGTLPRASIEDPTQYTVPPTNQDSTASETCPNVTNKEDMFWRIHKAKIQIHGQLIGLLPQESQEVRHIRYKQYRIGDAINQGILNQPDQLRDLFCACHEKLVQEIIKNADMEEQLKELQDLSTSQTTFQEQGKNAMDQALLLNGTAIPRLFIVLPQDTTQWEPLNPFTNRFRLFFLCECGEHTRSSNSRILHCTHFAKHEGYDLARPEQFFKEYGGHVLAIHRMIKLGVSVAGLSIPTLSLMVDASMADQHNTSLEELIATIDRGIGQIIGLIEENVVKRSRFAKVTNVAESMDALNAESMCKLDTFLKKRDADKVPGNLYKTISTEGHVRWVCYDHYYDGPHLKTTQALRDIAGSSPHGSFDESIGRLDVVLSSRDMAEQLYSKLVSTQSIYDLKVELKWDTTYSDLKDIYEALRMTKLEALELRLAARNNHASDIVNHGHRYDPILDIMRHPSIRKFALTCTPTDFFTRPSLSFRGCSFDNLRHMEIDLISVDAIPLGLKNLVTKTPNLASLTLSAEHRGVPTAYNAIAKYQKCPVIFKNQSLRILPPSSDAFQSNTTIQDVTDMFTVYGGQIEVWDVCLEDWPEESAVGALAQAAARNDSKLKDLTLKKLKDMSHGFVKSISNFVALSELCILDIVLTSTKYEEILEFVQWDHIRRLSIQFNMHNDIARIMTALMNGGKGLLNLEYFRLQQGDLNTMTDNQAECFRTIFSSPELQLLESQWRMTGHQVLDLLKSLKLSQLEYLEIVTEYMLSTDVQIAVDILEHAPELQTLTFHSAYTTPKQTDQMLANGVTFRVPPFFRFLVHKSAK
ncbi:hypothetical protein BGX31_009268 [Mortierella sp. GBA43]|nr:hypothetical protein BGX31_009268 [Mortierella sp. GBA43]